MSETAKPDRKQKVAEWLRSFAEEPGLEQVRQFWTPTDRSHAEQLIHPAHNDPVWTQASCQLVLTPTVLDRLDPMHQKRALEIGCGLGRILKPLSFLFEHCYGVDISSEMLRLGQEFLVGVERVETLLCDGRSLPIGDGQVDLVYSVICFQHLPARRVVQTYLEESFRVLRPGGLVRVQTVDVHLQPVQLGPHYGGAGYAYPSLDSFCEDLRGAGFTILEQERSDSGYLCATGLKAPI